MNVPNRKPDRQNGDIERGGTEPDPRVPDSDDEGGGRRVGPEDEDRRIRPGEKRPERIMP